MYALNVFPCPIFFILAMVYFYYVGTLRFNLVKCISLFLCVVSSVV